MKIAIQGERGSFSHEAARCMVPGCHVIPCARSAEVFIRVARGSADAAVIPIENSLAGSVAEHLDLLLTHKVFIQREFRLRIIHNLMTVPGVKLNQVRKVLSHPVALEQCRNFLRQNPKLEAVPFYDTAGSVKYVMEHGLMDSAGIAGPQAAGAYLAQILKAGIEDDKKNYTRFFLISKQKKILPSADKTSIAFGLRNVAGALFKALSVFALRDISLSKIESRPVRGKPWEYVFYLDFLRGQDDAAANALRHLAEIADPVKVLGIYPAVK
jgi:prephenate dehydratase